MPDNFKYLIIKALANAPAADLDKITKHVQTLCKGMTNDYYKTLIIQVY